ncbi:MAG: C39 family peptidase [Phycisphaeraceae bacterium]|nr:C39 family peptidase [Phycisphaerales bacterium]MCB9842236.1 C39 family peptidase [Phycisphaeraceae bacterium]
MSGRRAIRTISAALQVPDLTRLQLDILAQPNDVTCGPTCLHAVYRYFGDPIDLDQVIHEVPALDHGGTLAVMLGRHALGRGYKATLFTFNIQMFDPTWFPESDSAPVDNERLESRLLAQAEAKGRDDRKMLVATHAYIEFLRAGGSIRMRDATSQMITGFLRKGLPVLTGLSSTYLYRAMREFGPNDDEDDIRGTPSGHFVVLCGYDPAHRRVTVADPLKDNPGFSAPMYEVPLSRLVAAIMLGVLTYDANLLVIEPDEQRKTGR